MSVSHDAPSDPTLKRYLTDWEARMAKARKNRGPEKNTRAALTSNDLDVRAVSPSSPEYALKPLQPMERIALEVALDGGVNAYRMIAERGCTMSSARNAIAQMKRKLRARGVGLVDNRGPGRFDARLVILNKEAATALLRERFK